MARLIRIGSDGSGQELRAALVLAARTGEGFELVSQVGAARGSGLRAAHLAAVRAAAMACNARLAGAFEGSLELRFEPGTPAAGAFEFTLDGGTPVMPVLQTVLGILARSGAESQVVAHGPTHMSGSPTYHFVERHWLPLVASLGLSADLALVRAGFPPRAEGEVRAGVRALRAGAPLLMEERGTLLAVRGVAAAAHQRGDVARRVRDAAQALLWERRRIEATWEMPRLLADSPGSFAQMELVFERGRAAFGALGEQRVRPELAGERLARNCLRFLDGDAAVDRQVADQLAVALIASGQGGRFTVDAVTSPLTCVARVAQAFGVLVDVRGATGCAGSVEVRGA